jgi:hypothetical protein
MKFKVRLSRVEYQSRTVNVEAGSEEEARELAHEVYDDENSWEVMEANESSDECELLCDHNEMIANDDPGVAWKCAKCGYVYGKQGEVDANA